MPVPLDNMSSYICNSFQAHAWKKDLCANCMKSVRLHAQPVPAKRSTAGTTESSSTVTMTTTVTSSTTKTSSQTKVTQNGRDRIIDVKGTPKDSKLGDKNSPKPKDPAKVSNGVMPSQEKSLASKNKTAETSGKAKTGTDVRATAKTVKKDPVSSVKKDPVSSAAGPKPTLSSKPPRLKSQGSKEELASDSEKGSKRNVTKDKGRSSASSSARSSREDLAKDGEDKAKKAARDRGKRNSGSSTSSTVSRSSSGELKGKTGTERKDNMTGNKTKPKTQAAKPSVRPQAPPPKVPDKDAAAKGTATVGVKDSGGSEGKQVLNVKKHEGKISKANEGKDAKAKSENEAKRTSAHYYHKYDITASMSRKRQERLLKLDEIQQEALVGGKGTSSKPASNHVVEITPDQIAIPYNVVDVTKQREKVEEKPPTLPNSLPPGNKSQASKTSSTDKHNVACKAKTSPVKGKKDHGASAKNKSSPSQEAAKVTESLATQKKSIIVIKPERNDMYEAINDCDVIDDCESGSSMENKTGALSNESDYDQSRMSCFDFARQTSSRSSKSSICDNKAGLSSVDLLKGTPGGSDTGELSTTENENAQDSLVTKADKTGKKGKSFFKKLLKIGSSSGKDSNPTVVTQSSGSGSGSETVSLAEEEVVDLPEEEEDNEVVGGTSGSDVRAGSTSEPSSTSRHNITISRQVIPENPGSSNPAMSTQMPSVPDVLPRMTRDTRSVDRTVTSSGRIEVLPGKDPQSVIVREKFTNVKHAMSESKINNIEQAEKMVLSLGINKNKPPADAGSELNTAQTNTSVVLGNPHTSRGSTTAAVSPRSGTSKATKPQKHEISLPISVTPLMSRSIDCGELGLQNTAGRTSTQRHSQVEQRTNPGARKSFDTPLRIQVDSTSNRSSPPKPSPRPRIQQSQSGSSRESSLEVLKDEIKDVLDKFGTEEAGGQCSAASPRPSGNSVPAGGEKRVSGSSPGSNQSGADPEAPISPGGGSTCGTARRKQRPRSEATKPGKTWITINESSTSSVYAWAFKFPEGT